MKTLLTLVLLAYTFYAGAQPSSGAKALQVKTANGILEGTESSGIRSFKGIPFAQPPVGDLRWKAPQPVQSWEGVRKADKFGPRAMQRAIFGDMNFRSNGMSEDCLYLNVWTPAKPSDEPLPVLVYFYGGGFMAGDGSEPRYDGESMARRGIVTLTVNYRLGVFGFMAHPELTKESPNKASGNYGLLDQAAALQWVKDNISAFGGDPNKVTIAGESAGSVSVSVQMASPLSRDLIAGAIGESGSMMGTLPAASLKDAEKDGVTFAKIVGAKNLKALRAMPGEQILEATANPEVPRFRATIDGYFLPQSPAEIFAAGKQAQVPLMVGWNSEEMNYRALLGQEQPTPENYTKAVEKLYGERAQEVLKLYPAKTEEEVIQAATDLAGDRFIGYSTWKWGDLHSQTSKQPVYRYYYAHPRPAMRPEMGNATAGLAGGVIRESNSEANKAPIPKGAVHSAEIEYAMGNLPTNEVYAWGADDYIVSDIMISYFANFIKTGDPNAPGLADWPKANDRNAVKVLHIDVNTRVEPEKHRARYLFHDQMSGK